MGIPMLSFSLLILLGVINGFLQMNSIQQLAAIISGSGLLIILLAIPLILKKVPRNSAYGVRTQAAFASDADWYRINTIGGWYLLGAGILILATGIVGWFLPVSLRNVYSLSATGITLAAVLLPCLRLGSLKACSTLANEQQ